MGKKKKKLCYSVVTHKYMHACMHAYVYTYQESMPAFNVLCNEEDTCMSYEEEDTCQESVPAYNVLSQPTMCHAL